MWNLLAAVFERTPFLSRPVSLPPVAERRKNPRNHEVVRRPERTQARALEILAHAIEYLIDNNTGLSTAAKPEMQDAIQILAEKSRAVFAECPEVITLSHKLSNLLPRFLTLTAIDDPHSQSRIYRSSVHAPRVSREDE